MSGTEYLIPSLFFFFEASFCVTAAALSDKRCNALKGEVVVT